MCGKCVWEGRARQYMRRHDVLIMIMFSAAPSTTSRWTVGSATSIRVYPTRNAPAGHAGIASNTMASPRMAITIVIYYNVPINSRGIAAAPVPVASSVPIPITPMSSCQLEAVVILAMASVITAMRHSVWRWRNWHNLSPRTSHVSIRNWSYTSE